MFQLAGINVRLATRSEWPRIETFYRERNYLGVLSPSATVVVAEHGPGFVGLGRVQLEEGVLVLRGMRVDPRFQRRGVGSRILDRLIGDIGDRVCYCIPYTHLREFYGRVRFVEAGIDTAPPFLADRVVDYRGRGLEVLLMRR